MRHLSGCAGSKAGVPAIDAAAEVAAGKPAVLDVGAKPYETDLSRIRALYRLPTAPRPVRTLEVVASGQSAVLGEDWSGARMATCVLTGTDHDDAPAARSSPDAAGMLACRLGARLPYPAGSFDLIVLHLALDAAFAIAEASGLRFDPRQLMQQLVGLLVPGGVIAGCVSNRNDPRQLLARVTGAFRPADPTRCPGRYTIAGCRRLLQAAGLADVHVHNVLPCADSPVKVVEAQWDVARFAFGHELESRRPGLSFAGYWLRRAVLKLGLYPELEQSIYFWGCKPC